MQQFALYQKGFKVFMSFDPVIPPPGICEGNKKQDVSEEIISVQKLVIDVHVLFISVMANRIIKNHVL